MRLSLTGSPSLGALASLELAVELVELGDQLVDPLPCVLTPLIRVEKLALERRDAVVALGEASLEIVEFALE